MKDILACGLTLSRASMQCMYAIRVGSRQGSVQLVDEQHASDEDRFLLLGLSSDARLLLVCHCEREGGNVIRIISARKATEREAQFYRGE